MQGELGLIGILHQARRGGKREPFAAEVSLPGCWPQLRQKLCILAGYRPQEFLQ